MKSKLITLGISSLLILSLPQISYSYSNTASEFKIAQTVTYEGIVLAESYYTKYTKLKVKTDKGIKEFSFPVNLKVIKNGKEIKHINISGGDYVIITLKDNKVVSVVIDNYKKNKKKI